MKKLLFAILYTILSVTLFSQHQNILIDDVGSIYPPEEPSIIINPNNTNHIVAGANIDNVYTSTDAGYNWSKVNPTSTSGVWGDPCIIVDTNGAYYFFHLSNPQSGGWIDRIVCQKKDDINASWNDGSYMGLNPPKQQDKEWAVVDTRNNNIYVTWTQFDDYGNTDTNFKSNIHFSRSFDEGDTWSPALKINEVSGDCEDGDNTTEGAVPAVGPNGEIYVAWAGPAGLVFDRSYDEGTTWLDHDIFIADIPGGWDYAISGIMRCNGMPITKCDLSGGDNHGTIYVNWSDQRNGTDDTDVWLVKSTDGGDTWTTPKRVNDDPPGKQQFFTWMDIDQTNGHLYFVFYDRRNYFDENTDVYMALSKDGGETLINFKVSDSPFLPWSSIFFGDYTNVSAHDNIIRPIWARLQDGDLSVWTAIVDPNIVGTVESEIPDLLSLEQNYPNPFKESTFFAFKIKRPGEVSLKVYDMNGQLVKIIFENKHLNGGKYIESFDPAQYNMIPGVYYFSLSNHYQNLKRKMIFVE